MTPTTKRYKLKRKSCDHCSRTYYSRSHRSRWCSGVCQQRNWRENNSRTQVQLEQEYLAQEEQQAPQQEAA